MNHPNRRTLLKGGAGVVTGIALAGCSTLDAARGLAPAKGWQRYGTL